MPDFSLEREHKGTVAGIDEAGRGPWAGPVVAGAAILDSTRLEAGLISGLDDSKKLTPKKRATLFDELAASAAVQTGVGIASVNEIDEINILQATFLAMQRAVEDLPLPIDVALVDGNQMPQLPCQVQAVVKGDSRSLSIAAASIVAKVTRDRMMAKLAKEFPGYGWESNQGYGAPVHRQGLETLGVTPHHRKSYAPIRARLEKI